MIQSDNKQTAQQARLRYVNDDTAGITRKKAGKQFIYTDENGKLIKNKQTIARINALAIPPAYKDVWICPFDNGHIQATGRDARGRKQYRYHEKWNEVRDNDKYDKIIPFGYVLPKIRRTTLRHVRLRGLPKQKVLATIVQLLDKTHIRVGNEEYAQTNKSFGLTTMRIKHVAIHGEYVEFTFTGKSGVKHDIQLDNKRLTKVIRQCHDLPGYELFQYLDDEGAHHSLTSEDVNNYLKDISGNDFTAKEFRTWHGSVLACAAFERIGLFKSKTEAKKFVNVVVGEVAQALGNTKAVSRKSYIHPDIIKTYLNGSLEKTMREATKKKIKKLSTLGVHEIKLVQFLKYIS